jgi:hypothetical protein
MYDILVVSDPSTTRWRELWKMADGDVPEVEDRHGLGLACQLVVDDRALSVRQDECQGPRK